MLSIISTVRFLPAFASLQYCIVKYKLFNITIIREGMVLVGEWLQAVKCLIEKLLQSCSLL